MSMIPMGDSIQRDDIWAQLSAPEIKIATALVYTNSIQEACAALGMDYMVYAAMPQERKDLIQRAASRSAGEIANASLQLLEQSVLAATMALVDMLGSEDEEVRRKTATTIMHQVHGKPKTRSENLNFNADIGKIYDVRAASPQVWDEDIIDVDFEEGDDG